MQINDVTVCYMQENSPFLGGGGTTFSNPCPGSVSDEYVGQVNYWYDGSSNNIVVEYSPRGAAFSPTFEKCAQSPIENASQFHDPVMVELQYTPTLWGRIVAPFIDHAVDKTVPIYNAAYGPMKVDKVGNHFFDVQDMTRGEILSNMKPFEQTEDDFVQYSCDTTPDKNGVIDYSARLKIGGVIDPFDVTTIAMMYLIGFAIMVVFWIRR